MEEIILNYLLNEYKDLGENTYLSAVPKERLIVIAKELNALFELRIVSRSNNKNTEPIIGKIEEHGFTTPSNHGYLKIRIPYGHHKIEGWKTGDKVELIITD